MMIYWVLGGLTVALATVAVWAVCAVGGGSDAHIEMIEEQRRKRDQEGGRDAGE